MVLRIVRRASTVIAVVRSGRNNGVMDTRGDEPHALELFEQRGSETGGWREQIQGGSVQQGAE